MGEIITYKKEMIDNIIDWIQKNPFHMKEFIVEGFAFHVYWDTSLGGYFRVSMFFNPNWPHSTGFSCHTKEEFFSFMEEMITDAKKTFTNGGKYPDDYYSNREKN